MIYKISIENINEQTEVLQKIIELQQSYSLPFNELLWDDSYSKSGFLISAHTITFLTKLITSGATILYAIATSGELMGYILFYDGKLFIEQHTTTSFIDETVQNEQKHLFLDDNFIYLDQITVNSKFKGLKITSNLMGEFDKLNSGKIKIAAVLDKPIKNSRSHNFFQRSGYIRLGRFVTPNFKGFQEVISVVYQR